jgi:hypothetical protein
MMGDQSSEPPDPTSWLRMNQLVLGFAASQAIAVAATLGIADLVAEAPKTLEELAGALRLTPRRFVDYF